MKLQKTAITPTHRRFFLKGGENQKNLSVTLHKASDYVEEKKEDVHLANVNYEARNLIQYFGMGVGLGFGEDTVTYISAFWNPMFVFQGGRILGFEGRLSFGTTKRNSQNANNDYRYNRELYAYDEDPFTYSLVKAELFAKYHPYATEIYTTDYTPLLRPISGVYAGLGMGTGVGKRRKQKRASGRKVNFKTLSFPVGIGYDFASMPFSVFLEYNVYLKIPKNSIDFQLEGDTVLGTQVKFAF